MLWLLVLVLLWALVKSPGVLMRDLVWVLKEKLEWESLWWLCQYERRRCFPWR